MSKRRERRDGGPVACARRVCTAVVVKIGLVLLIGTVVSFLIAWTCVASQYDRLNHRLNNLILGHDAPDGKSGLPSQRVARAFVDVVSSADASPKGGTRNVPNMSLSRVAGFGVRVHNIRASAVFDGDEQQILGETIEGGWPMLSMIAVRAELPGFPPQPAGSMGWLRVLPARSGGAFGEPSLFSLWSGMVLPLRPLLLGTVCNVVFYSVCVATALALSRVAKGRWRRARGRCETCGYVVSGVSTQHCPECGARRNGFL